MKILCTHPGRFGDILWALPTVRALAEQQSEPVDLAIPGEYGSISPLLQEQPYIRVVYTLDNWKVQQTAPITPREPELPAGLEWDRIVHLGYESWPSPDLPHDVARRAGVEIDLERPWITSRAFDDAIDNPYPVVCGFSDEWFELKFGLAVLVARHFKPPFACVIQEGSRWDREPQNPSYRNLSLYSTDWLAAASFIQSGRVFLGCCSALHVLAVGLGKPCVVYEPNRDRHNPVFWPLGMDGRVRIVRGGDHLPTIDARHTADTIQQMLKEASK